MNSQEKLYIVVADNNYIYAVKAASKQESLNIVINEFHQPAEEIAARELDEMFRVIGKDCKAIIIN